MKKNNIKDEGKRVYGVFRDPNPNSSEFIVLEDNPNARKIYGQPTVTGSYNKCVDSLNQ